MLRRSILLSLGLLVTVISYAEPNSSPPPPPNSCIWFADDDALYQLQTASTNQSPLTIPLKLSEPGLLAMNAKDCGVWALTKKHLLHYDATGAQTHQIELRRLNPALEGAKHLAVNPFNENIWLGDEKRLYFVKSDGTLGDSWSVQKSIKKLDIGLDETLWVLGPKQVWHYDPTGNLLAAFDLPEHDLPEAKHLRYDSLGKRLWLAGEKQLIQFDLSQPAQTAAPAFQRTLPEKITAFTLNPRTGAVWLAHKDGLQSYSRDGTGMYSVDLRPLGIRKPEILAFDPISRSLWVGSERTISVFSDNGGYVASWKARDDDEALGVPGFAILPSLSLIRPQANTVTNNPTPTLSLGFDAFCNGQACGFDKTAYANYRLNATLNSQDVGAHFNYDSDTGQASYTPASPLPEGRNALTAYVTDGFGHRSSTVSSSFVIDTIPPRFLGITPADGSTLTTPNTTIGGSTDDPTATVLLTYARGAISGTQNFSFPVTLTPGSNSFELRAADPAGNTSTIALSLNYAALSLNVAYPATGSTVNSGHTAVNGAFQGPANTGITVNGVVAATDGNRYYVNNVPLNAGANTLTVTATAPDGSTVTQQMTVTSSGSDSIAVMAEPYQGAAPLPVTFALVNQTGNALQRIEADFDGNGTIDFTSTNPNALIAFTYTTPGVYQARITVTDSQNKAYTSSQVIVVRDIAKMDAMLRGTYSGMLDRLKQGNIDAALTAVTGGAYEKYKAVFTALKPDLASIVDKLGTITDGTISGDMAEYVIVRNTPAGPQAFLIYFILSEDGVWRIDGM